MTSTTAEPTPAPDRDAISRLEEQREFLLRSLDDLDRERAAGDIAEEDYRALRDDYTARAAATIRAIEAGEITASTPPPSRPSARRRRLVVAAALAGFAVLAGLLVAGAAGERSPGEVATGDIPRTSSDLLVEARTLFNRGDLVPALEAYDAVLDLDSRNPEALAYRGFLLVTAGSEASARLGDEGDELVAQGVQLLDQSLREDPRYLDALIFRAMARLYVLEDPEAALDDVRAALEADPPPAMAPRLAALHADVEEALAGPQRP